LSPMLRETTRHIAERVRAAGRLFALDVNYRAKLWSPKEATDYLVTLLPLVSILFSGVRDAARLFGLSGEPEDVGRALQERFRIPSGLEIGGAVGALHCTIVGDFAYVTRGEVEEFLASDDDEIQR